MPILTDAQITTDAPADPLHTASPSEVEAQAAQSQPASADVFDAAFRQGNSLGGLIPALSNAKGKMDARERYGYDPTFDFVGYAKARGQDPGHYVSVGNAAEAALIDAQLRREEQDRDVISRGGWVGTVAQVGAGVLDPINLIPGLDAVKGARTAGTLARSVVRTGAEAGLAVSEQELALQGEQQDRSLEESALNVAGGAVFGGIVGGGLHLVPHTRPGVSVERLQAQLKNDLRTAVDPQWQGGGSLSAAAPRSTTLTEEALSPAFGLEKFEAKNPISDNPILRTRQSPSVETRRISGELSETPLYLKGNDTDVASATAAESRMKAWNAPMADSLTAMKDRYHAYAEATKKAGGERLSYHDFRAEVAKAARHDDVHTIPEVAEAAKDVRRHILEPTKLEAIRLGLFPEDVQVTTAESYFPRMYDHDAISSNRNDFTKRLADWFETDQIRSEDKLPRGELDQIADEITNRILGSGDGRIPYDLTVPGPRGALKERTLNVPDDVLEPYLVNDADTVIRAYTRTMAADIELARAFGRPDMSEQIARISDDYDRLARKTTDGAEQARLSKQKERDIGDISAMRDRIRGTYGMPSTASGMAWARVSRGARNLNFLRSLGNVTLSSIPDVMSIAMTHGFNRTFGDLVKVLAGKTKGIRLAKEEVKLAGTALDMVLSGRVHDLNDVFTDVSRYSKPERAMEWASAKFSRWSLMDLWNTSMKQLSGVVTQTRMLEAIEAEMKGAVTAAEKRRLRMQGIDGDVARRIHKEFTSHGGIEDGTRWANTSEWTDKEAAAIFRAGLVKEVDRQIVTPGQEKPLWMSTELGRTIGQFKTFMFGSMTRTLLFSLQQRDANALQGMLGMLGMGMLSVYLKGKLGQASAALLGKDAPEMPKSPAQWIASGVDASGMLSWMFEANNILTKTTGIGMATAPTKYAQRSGVESLLGPTAGLANDVISSTRNAAGGLRHATGTAGPGTPNFTTADVHRIRRMVPFQNLFGLRYLFDEAEKGLDNVTGVPEPANRR